MSVYNQGFDKSTYSVKYLGIVDGAMGILSRKMALQGQPKDHIAGANDMVKVNQNITMQSSALGRRSISQKAPTINIR